MAITWLDLDLRHADFRRLWAGQTISRLGSQITALALPLVTVLALQASAFRVPLLGMFEMLPFLLFALPNMPNRALAARLAALLAVGVPSISPAFRYVR